MTPNSEKHHDMTRIKRDLELTCFLIDHFLPPWSQVYKLVEGWLGELKEIALLYLSLVREGVEGK